MSDLSDRNVARGDVSDEYNTLRDEILRADDQTVQLVGFAIVAASFWAAAVAQVGDMRARTLLLIGFNAVVLTLVLKVREKRGHQGYIAAYIRVFHERGRGWESRNEELRKYDSRAQPDVSGMTWEEFLGESGWRRERVTRLAEFAEMLCFGILSFLALMSSVLLALIPADPTSPNGPTMSRPWAIVAVGIQLILFVLVCAAGRAFTKLVASSKRWEIIWRKMQEQEEGESASELRRGLPSGDFGRAASSAKGVQRSREVAGAVGLPLPRGVEASLGEGAPNPPRHQATLPPSTSP